MKGDIDYLSESVIVLALLPAGSRHVALHPVPPRTRQGAFKSRVYWWKVNPVREINVFYIPLERSRRYHKGSLALLSGGLAVERLKGEFHEDRAFVDLDLQKAQVVQKVFTDCEFEKCDFTESVFRDCRFENCRFLHCDLSLIKPWECLFLGVVFEDTKLVGVNWTHATKQCLNFHNFHFSKCVLNYSVFMGLNLKKMKMTECLARDVDFAEADLTQAVFHFTDLTNSHFLHTNLTQADFTDARHYTIDPTCNFVKKTQFSLPEAVALLECFDIVLT